MNASIYRTASAPSERLEALDPRRELLADSEGKLPKQSVPFKTLDLLTRVCLRDASGADGYVYNPPAAVLGHNDGVQ